LTTAAVLDIGELAGMVTIEIYDLNGKLIRSEQQSNSGQQLTLERKGLVSGSYILRVLHEGEAIKLPFVVE